MAERLDYVKIAPNAILDAGCGTGEAIGELGARYPGRRASSALDLALPMVRAARERARRGRSLLNRLLAPVRAHGATPAPAFVCADVNSLPFQRRGIRSGLEQPHAAVGERPAARVRGIPADPQGRRALSVHDVRAGHAEGTARGVRARRRPYAHQPLRRHARSRRHARRGRLRRSGDGNGAADADLRGSRDAAGRTEGARRDERDARATARPDGRGALAPDARRVRADAQGRPHSGDIRSHLRPCVEGRATQDGRRSSRSSSCSGLRVPDAPDTERFRHRDRYGCRQDATSRRRCFARTSLPGAAPSG